MPPNFSVQFNPQIQRDIQKVVNYYRRKTGSDELGLRFIRTVNEALEELKHSALHYQIRYDHIRFLPMPGFSFVAHYRIDEEHKIVFVEAIFHTSESPDTWID